MRTISLKFLILALVLVSCNKDSEIEQGDLNPQELQVEPLYRDLGSKFKGIDITNYGITKRKAGEPRTISLYSAEYITDASSGESGNTIFFMNIGNRRTPSDFSPSNTLNGTEDIFYYIDTSRPSEDLDIATSTNAISRAMGTWDDVECADPNLVQIPSDSNFSTGLVASLIGLESDIPVLTEVNHVGWMGADFFENVLGAGASNRVLGVTFLFIWTEDGNPQDTNNDGRPDAALREIYYNDAFLWSDDATGINIETVALHEAGHALSQAHFGKAFRSGGNQKLHFSPRAVMNAAYSGVQTEIQETDNAGHCSNWASWPEN